MTLRQSHQLLLLGLQERIIRDQKSTGLLIGKTVKGGLDLARSTGIENTDSDA